MCSSANENGGTCLDEALAIRLAHEDRLGPVAAIREVIDRGGILDFQLASNDGKMSTTA
jgi:hypothetical protein